MPRDFEERKPPLVDGTMGNLMFPSGTAGDGKFTGEHPDRDGKDADHHYRCKQCGFSCDGEVVQSPGGTPTGDGGITVTVADEVGDPTISRSSCQLCGSKNSKS